MDIAILALREKQNNIVLSALDREDDEFDIKRELKDIDDICKLTVAKIIMRM